MGSSSRKKRKSDKKKPKRRQQVGEKESVLLRQEDEDDLIKDERFVAAMNRPQFQKAVVDDHQNGSHNQNSTKVVLDDRFAAVLTDQRFQLHGGASRDKYGRKSSKKNTADELKEFYTLETEGMEERESNSSVDSFEVTVDTPQKQHDDSRKENSDDEDPESRIAYLTALSRGEIDVSSSSEDESGKEEYDNDSDQDDNNSDEESLHGMAGILDPSMKEEAPEITHVASRYLAVTNMDWTHVRAVDLFAILSSFVSHGGVKRVRIFLSDFGKERMAKDNREGPSDVWKKKKTTATTRDSSRTEQVEDARDGQHYHDVDEQKTMLNGIEIHQGEALESDFDPEKLRAYEASKLKYYFAVAEFADPAQADIVYKEVDGMELEHSSAAIDLRSIDPDALGDVVNGRKVRDEAAALPSRYEPPDFVVNALQQTNVRCTWEDGDAERQRKLTRYGHQSEWSELAEGDDLRAYLASDNSSDEEGEGEGEDEGEEQNPKGASFRKLLGLDDDEDAEETEVGVHQTKTTGGDDFFLGGDSEGSDEKGFDHNDENIDKSIAFIPGRQDLEKKIREKLQSNGDEEEKLTPWQKFQQRRKEKRRERRKAARARRHLPQEIEPTSEMPGDGSNSEDEDGSDDEFFSNEKKSVASSRGVKPEGDEAVAFTKERHDSRVASSKAELELLLAGDNAEEEERDYDMRGLMRLEKNRDKKLKGARKRKEAAIATNTSGANFKINTKDNRFAAVMDGTDSRFGIDPTDSNFKSTPGMREIMANQRKRRRTARERGTVVTNLNARAMEQDSKLGISHPGAMALSSLVKSLKDKVSKSS